MIVTIFGGNSGTSLLKDLKLKVFLKNDDAARVLETIFPSSFTNENGSIVYNRDLSVQNPVDPPLIDKIQLSSSNINYVLIATGILFIALAYLFSRWIH